MKPNNPNCLHRAGSAPRERTPVRDRPIDSQTTQALHQLRLHAEEVALELAARLRVLGKSLAAACPENGACGRKVKGASAAYASIRRQLDAFFGSLVDNDFAGQHYFPIVQDYIQETFPFEVNGCPGNTCRIEHIEAVISLLSESTYENEAFSLNPVLLFAY